MDLEKLQITPPWEWPENADRTILESLSNTRADASERLLALELAGDFTVISDEMMEGLLAIVGNSEESDEIRSRAVVSMGPALEYADMDDFNDPIEESISEDLFHRIQDTLRRLYMDAGVPKDVRRRILEASVRAPQDWHTDAVRAGYMSRDEDWKLTAVFCMRYVYGFEDPILVSLKSRNPDIQFQAICAAGNWEVDEAWGHIAEVIESGDAPKDMMLAAMEAAVNIRPLEAAELMTDLIDADDEDIADAAHEAIAMAEIFSDETLEDDMEDEFGDDMDDDEFPF